MSARRDKRWAPHCGHDPARGRRHNSRVGEQAITARSCRAPSSNAATTCRGKRVCRTLHVVNGARRVRTSVERRRPRRRRVRREKRESACKPGSVRPTRGRPRQSFIWDARHRASRATYPNPTRATSSDSYLVLLQVGFTLPRVLPRARCALTAPFPPYPEPTGARVRRADRHRAVYFLWHFPSAHAAQALPGTLPCGARTFLLSARRRKRDCLAGSHHHCAG